MVTTPRGADSTILNVQIMCPLSGMSFDGQKITPHELTVRACRGERSLFGVCNFHMVRVFVNDPVIVARCLNAKSPISTPPAARA